MDKVGDTVVKVARNQGDMVPRDFAVAVKGIKLAILQSRARAAHASKPYRSFAPVIEGVRRELANGLKERNVKRDRR